MTKDRHEQLRIIRTKIRRFSDSDEDENEGKQSLVQTQGKENVPSYQSTLEGVVVEGSKEDRFSRILKQVEDIRSLIDGLQGQMDEISKVQSHILSSPIPDEKSKIQLEDFTSAIKRTSSIIRKKLKELESLDESDDASMAAKRMKKIHYQALLTSFADKMADFQILQTNYRDRCKERIRRQLEITGSHFTEEKVEEMLEAGNWKVFSQGILTETEQARKTLKDIEARHDEIIKLEQGIRELHDLLQDMAELVKSQGHTIDTIFKNVQGADEYVDEAKDKLTSAKKHQTSARKKKILIFLTVAVVIVIVIVLAVLLS